MSSVDERIVEMRFENGQFERGIAQTSRSLADFKSKLNLKGAAEGLQGLEKAASGIKLDNLVGNVDQINSKFSLLGAIGFTAMGKLTSSAIDFGTKLVGNVLDPLVQGGERRAENIAQAKFMLEGLKIAWEDIEPAINGAVRGTAYGLDEAARAASSLAASKVPLDKMEGSLRGIAGVAAMTGSGYSDIAQIFTTVAGNGKLMASELNRIGQRGLNAAAALGDFLGVTEEAARQLTTDGAISFEIFAAAMDKAYGSQATKANELYSGSLANLRAALSRIGQIPAEGKFERLRQIFNALAPKIDEVKDALLPLLNFFKELSITNGKNIADFITGINLKQLAPGLENVTNGFKNLMKIANMFGKVVRDVLSKAFPSSGAEGTWFINLTKGFENLTAAIIPSERMMELFKTTLSVIAGIVSLVWEALKHLWSILKAVGGVLGSVIKLLWDFVKPWLGLIGASEGTGDAVGNFFDMLKKGMDGGVKPVIKFLESLRDKIEDMREGGMKGVKFFEKFRDVLSDFAKNAGEKVMAFFDSFKIGLERLNGDGGIVERIKGFFASFDMGAININPLKNFGDWFKDIFGGLGDMLSGAWGGISPIVEQIAGGFRTVLDGIGEFLSGIDMLDVLAAGQTAGIIAALVMLYKHMKSVNGLLDAAAGLMNTVSGTLSAFQDHLKAIQTSMKIDSFLKIAVAIGILVGALWVLSTIETDKLWEAAAVLGIIAGGLLIFTKVMQKMSESMTPEQAAAMSAMSTALLLIAGSILMLAFAVKVLSDIDVWGLVRGVAAVVTLLLALGVVSKIMAKDGKGMVAMAFAIGVLAASLWLLVGVVKAFGRMDPDQLTQGGIAVAGALLALSGAMALMTLPKNTAEALKAAGGILIMVGSLFLLLHVMKQFAAMSWEDIGKGAAVAGGAILVLGGALVLLTKFAPGAMFGAGAFLIMAGALVVIAAALKMMQDLNPDRLVGSVLALITMLGALTIVALLLGNVNSLMGGIAVALIAAALILISVAIKNLADTDTGKLWGVVAALSVILLVFGVLAMILGKFPVAIAALLALTLAIAALAGLLFAFSTVINAFAGLVDSVVAAFVAFADRAPDMAKGLILLAEACKEVSPEIANMFILAAALGLLGIAAGIAGLGLGLLGLAMIALGAGLAIITVTGPLGAVALTAVVDELLKLTPEIGNIFALGAALGLLGIGMIAVSVGALLAAMAGGMFAGMLVQLAPALGIISPALIVLADAAKQAADGILPLIGLGIGLFVFGLGAGAAGVGALTLGAGLQSLARGLMMVAAVGEAGAQALVNITKKLAGLWTEAAKMGAVALALAGLGGSLLLFGTGLTIAALGLTGFTIAMKLFNSATPTFVTMLSIFASSLPPAADSIGKAIAILASAINSNVPEMSNNLLLFGLAAMIAAPGLLTMATAITAFTGTASGFLSSAQVIVEGTKILSNSVGTNLESLADSVESSSTLIASAMALLSVSVVSSMGSLSAAFVTVGTTMMAAMTQGIMTGMSLAQMTIIIGIIGIITMLAGTISGLSGLFIVSGVALGMGLASGISSTSGAVASAGLMVILGLIAMFNSGRFMAQVSGIFIVTGLVIGIRSMNSSVRAAGLSSALSFVSGVSGANSSATSAGMNLSRAFVSGLSAGMAGAAAIGYSGGFSVGTSIASGASAGINASANAVAEAARSMVSRAVNAAKAEADINSPSRVFRDEVGFQMGMGTVGGLGDSEVYVEKAAAHMGAVAIAAVKETVAGLGDALEIDPNMSPTIRPILDLTEVQKASSQIGTLLQANPLNTDVSANLAASYEAARRQRKLDEESSESVGTGDTNYNFEQTIVSPKAVSTGEVYRQTKNLISKAKKAGDDK